MPTAGSSILIPHFLELRISRLGDERQTAKEQQTHNKNNANSKLLFVLFAGVADLNRHVRWIIKHHVHIFSLKNATRDS
jgi:hypothetical protein